MRRSLVAIGWHWLLQENDLDALASERSTPQQPALANSKQRF